MWKQQIITLFERVILLQVIVLFVKPLANGHGSSWYPVLIPIHTRGHHHRHTTHVVMHPVVRTRVLVIGDNDHHHHHQHNHGHSHNHGHQHGHHHAHHHHGGHYSAHDRSPDHVKYSTPSGDSGWTPKSQVSQGYLPLRFLKEDREKVQNVVFKAIKESEDDQGGNRELILPLGIGGLHNPPMRFPASLRHVSSGIQESGVRHIAPGSKRAWRTPSLESKPMMNLQCDCKDS